jgi:hypothetical protein
MKGNKSDITISAHRLPIIIPAAFAEDLSANGLEDILPGHEQMLQSRLLAALATPS